MSDPPRCEFPRCGAPAFTGVTTPDGDERTIWLCPPHYREHQIGAYRALLGWITMPRDEPPPENGHRRSVKLHRAKKGQRG